MSFVVVAENPPPPTGKLPRYAALEVSVGDQDNCEEAESTEVIDNLVVGDIGSTWKIYSCTDWWGYNSHEGPVNFPPSQGCIFDMREEDTDAADDCGYANIYEGTIITLSGTSLQGKYYSLNYAYDETQDGLFLGFGPGDDCDWGDDNSAFYECGTCPTPFRSESNKEYLCGSMHFWYECSEISNGLVTWVDNYLYNCTQDPNTDLYNWVKQDIDADYDGYLASEGDTHNDPTNDPINCPKPLLRDLMVGLTLEEARSQVAELCVYPRDSACSICRNPGAPEWCGDGIDNDCNEETSDDCNLNQYACQLDTVPLDSGLTDQENVFAQKFPWIEVEDTSFCCGYNGAQDNGKIIVGKHDLTEYICVNKNMIGSAFDITNLPGAQPVEGGENWYLLPANIQNFHFKVITINTPGTVPYDVVSDSEQWQNCNTSTQGSLISTNPNLEADSKTAANHFSCYQEGEHWSWAECYGAGKQTFNDKSIKGRNPGDGEYSLYLGESTPGNEFILKDSPLVTLNSENGQYNKFYGAGSGNSPFAKAKYDFSGYDQLEFFVRFGDLGTTPLSSNLPFNVKLEIYSADDTSTISGKLFSQSVLGYAANSPFLGPDNWMHLKVPIPNNLKGVSHLIFTSDPETANMQIKNVYLSKTNTLPQICSGADSPNKNSWLTSFDDGSTDSMVNGEQMCINHYGQNAWLGNEKEVLGENALTSYCCGDDDNEYYFGSSKTGYGCWNSMPIASGNTTMNVKFSLTYNQPIEEISYPNVSVTYTLTSLYKYDDESTYGDHIETKTYIKDISYGISVMEMPTYSQYITGTAGENILQYKLKKLTLTSAPNGVKFYFFDTEDGQVISDDNINPSKYDTRNLLLLAEWRSMTPIISSTENSTDFNYPCNQETCYFPLKGEPPYTIINTYPDLYELYFIEKNKDPQLVTEANSEFNALGTLMAKKVAQQVVYVNTASPQPENSSSSEETDQGFYGCEAADFLPLEPDKNLPYCSIKANLFCSPSVTYEIKNDKYTTINSWSSESLTELGYEEPQPGAQNLTDFAQGLNLVTLPLLTAPEQRNYSAQLLPGRNIIPNAGFILTGTEVSHWDIINSEKEVKELVQVTLEGDYKLILNGEILQSERIPVPEGVSLYLSHLGSATRTVYFINRNGERSLITDNPFQIEENASYLLIEFTEGDVYHPMLQVLDAQGINRYTYNDRIDRGGAACCPTNSCWNGYLCVSDMSEKTSLFEPVNVMRNYRCIKGEWKYLPSKMDWTGDPDHWGYCERNDQCFVLASSLGGIKTNTALDFYLGSYPTCINSGEYIFDHYCDNGNWTSRTKFLVGKLIEAGQNNDYTLYCSNYKNTLPEYEQQEPLLGGRISQQVASANEDPLAVSEAKAISSCFDKIMNGEGKRLVQDIEKHHENTCVNNFCILKYKESGATKIAFATSLNQPINSSDSFLPALSIPLSQVETACPSLSTYNQSGFVRCDLPELEGDLWYSPQLNSIIYAKNGIQLSPGLFQKITDWFKNLFSTKSELSPEQNFVEKAQNFREAYLSKQGDKKVRVLQEYFSEQKQMLVAEYENYDTPICSPTGYLFNLKAPAELEVELFNQVSGEGKLTCSQNGTTQKVEAIAGLDFLWPQLTAQLRPEEN
ncbi:MAG: hypothetical protein WCV90_04570 [Candidatus Woesearchaeota archaeon]